jgi:hypothetical protein
MRHLKTQGQILSPQVRDMAPGRPIIRFGLRTMDREGATAVHPCVGYGEVAHKLSRQTEGDMVEVVARLVTNTRVGRKPLMEYIVTEFTLLKSKP